jgi:hypothetical protein
MESEVPRGKFRCIDQQGRILPETLYLDVFAAPIVGNRNLNRIVQFEDASIRQDRAVLVSYPPLYAETSPGAVAITQHDPPP